MEVKNQSPTLTKRKQHTTEKYIKNRAEKIEANGVNPGEDVTKESRKFEEEKENTIDQIKRKRGQKL